MWYEPDEETGQEITENIKAPATATGQTSLKLSPFLEAGLWEPPLHEDPQAREGTYHPLPHGKLKGCWSVWAQECSDVLPDAATPSAFLGICFFFFLYIFSCNPV